ncbi:MAG: dihydroxyacetone kinase subunit DhaL [Pseudomonadota bacterium]
MKGGLTSSVAGGAGWNAGKTADAAAPGTRQPLPPVAPADLPSTHPLAARPAGPLPGELARRALAAIADHADRLSALDRAIGDGDHGANMLRGFGAVAGAADRLAAQALPEALQAAGHLLVMKTGGASGPLYGSLLDCMGKAAPAVGPRSGVDLAQMLDAGIDAIKLRGRSDAGAKTMLDVLIPVQMALASGGAIRAARDAADTGLEATRAMRAKRGRAAFLGARSVGHLDPGACSAAVLVHMVCDLLEEAGR